MMLPELLPLPVVIPICGAVLAPLLARIHHRLPLVVGLWRKGSFLDNWLPLAPQQTIRAGGTLQLFSGAELVEVATGLTIAVFALLGMRHEWSPDEDADRQPGPGADSGGGGGR